MISRAVCVAIAGLACVDSAAALVAPSFVTVDGKMRPRQTQMRFDETTAPPPAGNPQPEPKAPHPVQKDPVQAGNPLWAIPLRQLSATRDRPLFSPGRRPPAPPALPVAAAPPPPPPPKPAEPERPQLSLLGTILSATDKLGIFLDQTSRSAVRLRVNDSHQGWTLKSVGPREATVQKNETTVVVALPVPGDGKSLSGLHGAQQNPQQATTPTPAPSDPTISVAKPSALPPSGSPPRADDPAPSAQRQADLEAFREEAAKIGPPPALGLQRGAAAPFGGRRER